MNNYKKTGIFLILLTGLLTCLMASMLYLGGGVNLKCFLGAEQVYDFPERDLTKDSKGWEYHGDAKGYSIVKANAVNKYRVDRKAGTWKCLYVTIDQMNVAAIPASLEYYDKEMELLAEQPISLSLGENIIFMNEDIKVTYIGIRIRDAKGTFFSIQSMQTRSEVSGFTPERFAKAMTASYGTFLLLFAAGMLWQSRTGKKPKLHTGNNVFLSVLQSLYRIPGDFFGERVKRRVKGRQRNRLLRSLFCMMFLWIMISNVIALDEGEAYRYFVLVCGIFLLLEAVVMWERPLVEINWSNPLALSWCGLWVLVIISDIFVDAGNKFIGYFMLFAAGFLIFVWNQMERPRVVLELMAEALEINFGLAVVFCMVFRQKKTAVYYNGIFGTSEEMAMYSLLMFAIFLVKLLGMFEKKGMLKFWVLYGSGAAVSLYFVLCSGGLTAYIALAVTAAAALGMTSWRYIRQKKHLGRMFVQQLGKLLVTAGAAALLTAAVHMAVEQLPGLLGTDMAIQEEQLISALSSEELSLYQTVLPEELEDVVSWDTLKVDMYQKSYARMLGLVGNISQLYVYREPVSPYNGYLAVMYRYGIYAVIPFLLYQIYGVYAAAANCKGKDGKEYLWILLVNIIYIVFCIGGNAGIALENPLVWCFFLMNGYSFFRNS